jgi:hypothetical protein
LDIGKIRNEYRMEQGKMKELKLPDAENKKDKLQNEEYKKSVHIFNLRP